MTILLGVRCPKLAKWLTWGSQDDDECEPAIAVFAGNEVFVWAIDPDAFRERA
jgi:hypothetical protein